jgi:hypothetical protein
LASGPLCAKEGIAATQAAESRHAERAKLPVNRQAMTVSLTAECGTARPNSTHSGVNEPDVISVPSALAGFEAALRLIDDVNAALPAHDPVIAVPTAKRL